MSFLVTPEQLINDLEWIMRSPSLVNTDTLGVDHLDHSKIQDLALVIDRTNTDNLIKTVEARPRLKLGAYYELLNQHLLNCDPDVVIHAANQQVIIDKQTLGEFDLLYQRHSDGLMRHCEIAIKYYLGVTKSPATVDNTLWIGPDLRDRLDLKLRRLQEHQLVLSRNNRVKNWMKQSGLPRVDRVELSLQGLLFYHVNVETKVPPAANSDQPGGHWLTASELEKWWHDQNLRPQLIHLPKMGWISGFTASAVNPAHVIRAGSDAETLVNTMQRPQMFQVEFLEQPAANGERLMIVPDSWHKQALQIHHQARSNPRAIS